MTLRARMAELVGTLVSNTNGDDTCRFDIETVNLPA